MKKEKWRRRCCCRIVIEDMLRSRSMGIIGVDTTAVLRIKEVHHNFAQGEGDEKSRRNDL